MDNLVFRAVKQSDRVFLERAMRNGEVNPNLRDKQGNTLLHIAVELKRNEITIVQLLLDSGFNPNDQNNLGATPLHYCCVRKDSGKHIADLLIAKGGDPNIPMHTGHTALHVACEKHKPELVQLFCAAGASAVAIDAAGNNPLHLTLLHQGRDTVAKDIVEILVQYGINPRAANQEGYDALLLSSMRGFSKVCNFLIQRELINPRVVTHKGNNCIHEAAAGGHAELIDVLVTLDSALINARNEDGNTPLHLAAINNRPDVAVTLIRKGASGHVKNSEGKTPYDLVAEDEKNIFAAKHPDIVRTLAMVRPKRAEPAVEEDDAICRIF